MTSVVQNKPRLALLVKSIGVIVVALVVSVSGALGAEFKIYEDFDEGLEAAKIAGKPLLVDYYTDW